MTPCVFEPVSATMCRCVRCHTYARLAGGRCPEGVSECRRPEGPGAVKRTANLTVATARHVAAGLPIATIDQIAKRFAICTGCNLFLQNSEKSGICTHGGCGCNVVDAVEQRHRFNKAAWQEQRCPHPSGNRWAMTDAELRAAGHPDNHAHQ